MNNEYKLQFEICTANLTKIFQLMCILCVLQLICLV